MFGAVPGERRVSSSLLNMSRCEFVCKPKRTRSGEEPELAVPLPIVGTLLHTPIPIVAAYSPRTPRVVPPLSVRVLLPPSTTPRCKCWLSSWMLNRALPCDGRGIPCGRAICRVGRCSRRPSHHQLVPSTLTQSPNRGMIQDSAMGSESSRNHT